jgi:hypothetical protein
VATVIGSMEDVRKKISKANGAFNQLQKVWKSSYISLRTKLILCETRRVTQEIYIVTCQPILGLRNRALLGSRPVNKIPRSRDDVTLKE